MRKVRLLQPENVIGALLAEWSDQAERLRALEAHGQAAAFEYAARDLEKALAAWGDELLTIDQAAAESG